MVHLRNLRNLMLEGVPRLITRAVLTAVKAARYREVEADDVRLDELQSSSASFVAIWERFQSIVVEARHREVWLVESSLNSRRVPILSRFRVKIKSPSSHIPLPLEETLRWVSTLSPSTPSIRLSILPSNPLVVTASILQACPGLSYLRLEQEVLMDAAFGYLSRPIKTDAGRWSWPCPGLEEVNIKKWRGSELKLLALARARWEEPGGYGEGVVPRKRLRTLLVPRHLKLDRLISDVLQNCAHNYSC